MDRAIHRRRHYTRLYEERKRGRLNYSRLKSGAGLSQFAMPIMFGPRLYLDALCIIGQEIERLYGSARFVVLYLLTGIAGSIASFFYRPEAASAGASGAIFGLFGVLAVFAFRYRKEIPHITEKMLIQHLRELEADKLIQRKAMPVVPPHVEYSLTKIAMELTPILNAMAAWGVKHNK